MRSHTRHLTFAIFVVVILLMLATVLAGVLGSSLSLHVGSREWRSGLRL